MNPEEGQPKTKRLVVPIFCILVAMIFAFLAFLPSQSSNAEQAFHWLSSMTAAATMLSWTAMMVTYIRWHAGIKHAETQDVNFKNDHPELYRNRSWLQPFLAWYAIVMCTAILLLHGWAVFTIDAVRRIAMEPGELPSATDPILGNFTMTFVTSYLPIPLFLLCILGYKLINQTSFVELHEMPFDRQDNPTSDDEHPPATILERLANMFVP